MRKSLLFPLILIFISGSAQEKSISQTKEKFDQQEIATRTNEILRINDNFNDAVKDKDLPSLMQLYHGNEVYWLPPNSAKSIGLKAIKDNYSFITSSNNVKLWHVVDKIFVGPNDNIASMMGSYHFRIENQSLLGDDGKFFLLLAKVDNKWKIKSDIYNSDFPTIGEKQLIDKPDIYIHTFTSESPGSVNSNLIITPEGIILIDALRTTSEAKKLTEVIKRFERPLVAIIITHAHPEHFGGLEYISATFPKAPIYSSKDTKDEIATDKNGYIRLTKRFVGENFGSNIPVPNRIIDSVLRINGIELIFDTLRNGEAQSINTIQIKSTDIVFSSDLLNNHMIPFLAEGNTQNWLQQLDLFIKKYPPKTIVYPGHGIHGSIEELVAFQMEYITTIRNLVRSELKEKQNLNSDNKKRILSELNIIYQGLDGVSPLNSLNSMNIDAVANELRVENKMNK